MSALSGILFPMMAASSGEVLENGIGSTIDNVVESGEANINVSAILPMIKTAVGGVFDIATSAFSFLLSTPLCAFMVGSGFAFSALGLARKALRVAKRT